MQRLRAAVPVSQDAHFVPAPAYDEEHPEELSYRPFPIAPLLTLTASVDLTVRSDHVVSGTSHDAILRKGNPAAR